MSHGKTNGADKVAESPQLRIRLTEEMRASLAARAERDGTTMSQAARDIIAKALKNKELATVRTPGRPPISENLKKL